jgi:catechol 2,3-dioxygenase-like lactoylglutathione lyase family enzyme
MDFNHLHLGVDDVGASRAFYELLGFREDTWHGGAMFMRNAEGFDLALAPVGRQAMPEWFHVGCRLESPDAVRAARGALADRVFVSGDDPDFVWFRVNDPDGYQIEVYWEA